MVVHLPSRNRLKTSFWQWNSSREFPKYLIWRQYGTCTAIMWNYTKIFTHNRSSVEGIHSLANEFERVAAQTGTISHLSAFICLPLHWVTSIYGLLKRVKPGCGGIIALSWVTLSIPECCSRKDATLSIKLWSIPRYTVWRVSSKIIVVREFHFRFQKRPSGVLTARSYRYYLASILSISSRWVVSIIMCKYGR